VERLGLVGRDSYLGGVGSVTSQTYIQRYSKLSKPSSILEALRKVAYSHPYNSFSHFRLAFLLFKRGFLRKECVIYALIKGMVDCKTSA
jgi:hypothetical protein